MTAGSSRSRGSQGAPQDDEVVTGPAGAGQLPDDEAVVDPAPGPAEVDGVAGAPHRGGAMSSRKLGRTAVLSALSNLTLPVTALLSGPILAHTLGVEGRGEMTAAIAPVFVLMFVANLGLPEATTYGIAALRQDPRRVFWKVARVSMLCGVLAATGVWFGAGIIMGRDPSGVEVLRTVALMLPLLMLVIILRFAVSGMRQFRAVNTERVLTPILRLAAFVVLLVAGTLTVQTAAVSQVAATVIGGCYLFVTLRRHRTPPEDLLPEPPHLTRRLTGYGIRGWGAVFGNLVNWRLDQLVLIAFVSRFDLGLYAVAVHFSELPSTAVNAVRNVLFAESAYRGSTSMIARAARITVLLVLSGVVVAGALAYWLLKYVFGDGFTAATQLARVLMLATVPFCVEQVLAAGLLAQGRPGRRSVGQITAAVVTVAGLFTLVPLIGVMGAALTSLIAYSVNCSIAVWQFRRLSGLSVSQILVPRPSDAVWVVQRMIGRRRRGGGGRGAGGGAAGGAAQVAVAAVGAAPEVPSVAVDPVPSGGTPLARHRGGRASRLEQVEVRQRGRHRAEGRPLRRNR